MTPNIIRCLDNICNLRCVLQFFLAIGVSCTSNAIGFGQTSEPGPMNIGSTSLSTKFKVTQPPVNPSSIPSAGSSTVQTNVLTHDEAIRLALAQASAFQA